MATQDWFRRGVLASVWSTFFALAIISTKDEKTQKDLLAKMIQLFNPHLQMALITLYWGYILHRFDTRRIKVPYRPLLRMELNSLAPPYMKHAKWTLYCIAVTLLGYSFMFARVSESLASIFPALLYAAGLAYVIYYIKQSSTFTYVMLKNTFIPSRQLHFVDMFFLDIFTSFAKDLGEFMLSGCTMMKAWGWTGADKCGSTWFPMGVSCIPMIVGSYQGLKLLCNPDLEEAVFTRHLYNVFRSLLIIIGMIFAELHNHVDAKLWQNVWIGSWGAMLTCYSCMSIFWDIVYDWDLRPQEWLFSCNSPTITTCIFTGRRRKLYYVFIFVDIIFRFVWGVRLSGDLFAKPGVGFLLSFCELGRRMIWIPLRIEAELRKDGSLPIVPNEVELEEVVAEA